MLEDTRKRERERQSSKERRGEERGEIEERHRVTETDRGCAIRALSANSRSKARTRNHHPDCKPSAHPKKSSSSLRTCCLDMLAPDLFDTIAFKAAFTSSSVIPGICGLVDWVGFQCVARKDEKKQLKTTSKPKKPICCKNSI